MIETADQRAQRIKAEEAVRAERAKAYAEKMKSQLAPSNATPAAVINSDGPLNILQAKRINAELHRECDNLADKFLMAKRREIWRPLGYGSWAEYGAAEFGKGKSRMYQLVDFAETKELLSDSTIVESPLKESQTRPMKHLNQPMKKKAWKRAVKIANGQPSAKQVVDAIAQVIPGAVSLGSQVPAKRSCPHCGGTGFYPNCGGGI